MECRETGPYAGTRTHESLCGQRDGSKQDATGGPHDGHLRDELNVSTASETSMEPDVFGMNAITFDPDGFSELPRDPGCLQDEDQLILTDILEQQPMPMAGHAESRAL
jgi:hypothetical protein